MLSYLSKASAGNAVISEVLETGKPVPLGVVLKHVLWVLD